MKRSALLGALATGALLVAGSAFATGVYVNGVYTESGGTVTVPANGSITISPSYGGTATSVAPASTYPTIGTVYEQPVTTHGSYSSASSYSSGSTYSSGQYQVIDTGTTYDAATTYETVPAYEPAPIYETAPMYEAAPAAVPAYSHAPVRVEPIAPATVTVNHATPAPVAEPAQRGWGRSRIYIAPRASIVLPTDTEYTLREQGLPPLKLENAYNDVAWGGSVALGFQAVPMGWGVNVRTEIEGGYQSQEVDSHNLVGVQTVGGDDARGDTNLLYGFVNLYGDIPVLHGLGITLGGGAGIGRVEFDGHGTRAAGNALDDSATAFGYHLDAGVSYDITDAVTLEAMYRYQSFVNAELKTTAGNEEKVDLNTHNIVLGARIGF